VVAFLGGAVFGLPPLAPFWLLAAPFFVLAAFFEEALSGAASAPCAAKAATVFVVSAFSLVMFV
jgi:hypothetical protein